jgi:hypothetical protein
MKIARTVYPDHQIDSFTAHQIYIHNLMNKVRGYRNQLVSNKIEFPKACHSKNKFKN